MIPADKNPFFDSLMYFYLKRMLRRNFYSIEVRGLAHLKNLQRGRPAIGFANHTNWWDGLIIFYLTRFQRHKDFYCMMEEKQLRHYPFFCWIGAYSVDPANSLRAAGTIRYTSRLLTSTRNMIWIFPQGEMVRPHVPVRFKPGLAFMAERFSYAQMLPVAFHYEFLREQKPHVYINIGEPFLGEKNTTESSERLLQGVVDELQLIVRRGEFDGFERILAPSLSINKRWEWWTHLLAGKLDQYRDKN
jgi:1-acyl-sn-glycerol-3-phosphate acyltransferase